MLKLKSRVIDQIRSSSGDSDADALEKLYNIARLADSNWPVARTQVVDGLNANSHLLEVGSARQAIEHLHEDALDGLELIKLISVQSRHKNVRRVAAREKAVRFLAYCIDRADTQPAAMSILDELLVDEDEIIPRTVFDIIEFGLRDHPNLLRICCETVASNTKDPRLMTRVNRCLTYLKV